MWDAATGAKQYTFEGHEAPVYSVCPHYKENIQVEILNYETFAILLQFPKIKSLIVSISLAFFLILFALLF